MRFSKAFPLLSLALLASGAFAAGTPGTASIDRATLTRLATLPKSTSVEVAAFPAGPGVLTPIRFERLDVYAANARIVEEGATGERELPRSQRIYLIGQSADGATRVGLEFDPGFTNVSGIGTGPNGSFSLRAEKRAGGIGLSAVDTRATLPKGVEPQFQCGDDELPLQPASILPPNASAPTPHIPDATEAATSAIVAIDTDNEFMSIRFGNDTTAATTWIASLFLTMNVMYQRDLNVTLVQGSTTLRTTTDPYTQAGTPANQADLNEFGNYWQAHFSSTPRVFAALLSGKSQDGLHASGIAWINGYCDTQSNGGGYSINQIFTNPGVGVDLSARIVGHEIGHNFGAWHTHCTNISTGAAPVATNTIDTCVNSESSLGCYGGSTTNCPATGPGNPLGTIMSYCNIRGCGQNVLQFHPTHVSVLSNLIVAHTGSCLALGSNDQIFKTGFETTP